MVSGNRDFLQMFLSWTLTSYLIREVPRPKGGASLKPKSFASASLGAAVHPHAKHEAFWQG